MNKKVIAALLSFSTGAVLALNTLPLLAHAESSAPVDNSAKSAPAVSAKAAAKAKRLTANEEREKTRGSKEIDRRVTALGDLETRLGNLKKISDSDKASLGATVQAQVNALTAVKTKIENDTDTTTLKTDVKSVTDSYRTFALVIPQGRILAVSDQISFIVGNMTILETKLQARMVAAQTSGKDISSLQPVLTDLGANPADAQSQAQAAVTEISKLTPDTGDKTILQKNTKALKDAREKIKIAEQELKDARKDSMKIVQALKAMGLDAAAATTPPATPASTPAQ